MDKQVNSERTLSGKIPETSALSNGVKDLLMREYDGRLERFRQLAGQQSQLQQWALVFTGGLWAWVLGRQASSEMVVAAWIPVITNAFFYFKAQMLGRLAIAIFSRLNTIGSLVGGREDTNTQPWIREDWEPWTISFWIVVELASAVAAALYTYRYFT